MGILDRIKQLMSHYQLNNNSFSKKIGATPSTINSMFEKKTRPSLDTIDKILNVFTLVSIEWLITGNGDMFKSDVDLEKYSLNEIETFVNKNGIKFFIYDDESVEIEVCILPFEAYASSNIENYFDLKYTDTELRKVKFRVDKIGKGVYFGFKTKNNSMNGGGIYDTPNGAEVLGRELGRHLWDKIHKNDYGFILMTENAILHKDILGYDSNTGMLKLHSRNPSEEDFEISINTVYRIFTVIKRTF